MRVRPRSGAGSRCRLLARVAEARPGARSGPPRAARPARRSSRVTSRSASQWPYGRARREPLLDRRVLLAAPRSGSTAMHLARAELAAADRAAVRQRRRRRPRTQQTTRPSSHDGVPQRPQPVAVERGADDAPVGEDDAGGPVPRLDEPASGSGRSRGRSGSSSALPSHAGGMSIASACRTSRPPRTSSSSALSSIAESEPDSSSTGCVERVVVGAEVALARAHPVDVALDGVDLAVVAEERNGCARSHDGAVFVEKRWWKIPNGTVERRVAEVDVELGELVGGAERLVRDRAERERGDVGAGRRARRAGARGRRAARPRRRRAPARRGAAARSAACTRAPRPRARRGRPAPRASRAARGPPRGRRPRSRRGRPRRGGRPCRARTPGSGRSAAGIGRSTPGAVAGLAVGGDRAAVADAAEALEQRVDDLARGAAARRRRRSRCRRRRARREARTSCPLRRRPSRYLRSRAASVEPTPHAPSPCGERKRPYSSRRRTWSRRRSSPGLRGR